MAISSRTQQARNDGPSLFRRSQYALSEQRPGDTGALGCVLLKPITLRSGGWREGETLTPGTIIPAEVAQSWPIANRMAMENSRYVRFFADEADARAAGAFDETVAAHPTRAAVKAGMDKVALMNAARERKRLEREQAAAASGDAPADA